MKEIEVAGAAIMKDGKLFIAKRPDKGEAGLKWEFPGGKIEAGETPKQALIREIEEELEAEIEIDRFITTVKHQYQTFHLTMHVFLCHLNGNDPVLEEHVAPSSRAEGLLFLHGLESNPGSSLQTEEEAGLP